MFKLSKIAFLILSFSFIKISFSMQKPLTSQEQALFDAIDRNNINKIKELIDLGVNVNAMNKNEIMPLGLAIYNRNLDVVKILVEAGADVNSIVYAGGTALNQAIVPYDKNIIIYLINHGANLNQSIEYQAFSPLTMAIATNTPKFIIDMLIDNGANIKLKDKTKRNAWEAAFQSHFHDVYVPFIENKIKEIKENIIKVSSSKDLPFDWQKRLLFTYASNLGGLNVKNPQGNTPLHLAIINNNFDLAKWIADRDNSLVKEANNLGQTPLELGFGLNPESENWLNFVNYLKEQGYMTQEDIDKTLEKIESHVERERKEAGAGLSEAEKLHLKD